MRDRSVGEHHELLEHVVDRLAVEHRARARGVVRHHAADGGAAGRRDVRRETKPVRRQRRVQLVQHDAGLDARPAFRGVDFEKPIEIFRGVDDEAGADRLTGLRRAASPHRQRAAMLPAGGHDRTRSSRDLERRRRRLNLVDAGVGRVERARHGVEPHFAFDLAFELRAPRRGRTSSSAGIGVGDL